MYNFDELNRMDDERLQEAAKAIGIKKINLTDKEGLVYEILEKQARDHAASASANVQSQEKKRRQKGLRPMGGDRKSPAARKRMHPRANVSNVAKRVQTRRLTICPRSTARSLRSYP